MTLPPKRCRQKLRTHADAEIGDAGLNRFANERDFARDPSVAMRFARMALVTAPDDHRRIAFNRRRQRLAVWVTEVLDLASAPAQHIGDAAVGPCGVVDEVEHAAPG